MRMIDKLHEIVRHALLLLPALLLAACGSDPVDTTGSVTGTVKDDITDAFISGATVSLTPSNLSTTTDGNGNYQFLGVEQGQYTLTVRKSGYKETSTTVQVMAGKSTIHNFSLQPSASALRVNPDELDFGTSQTQLGLDIINEGSGTLKWFIAIDVPWLTARQKSQPVKEGVVLAQKQTSVIIGVDRTGLAPGDYSATIIVTSTDGGHVDVPVRMTVVGLPQFAASSTVSEVTAHTARVLSTLTVVGDKNGVTEYGHVYSATNSTPTLEHGDAHTDLHVTGGTLMSGRTLTSNLTALRSATTYYVRAYARNRLGYAYSQIITFRTGDGAQTGMDRNDFGGEEDWNQQGE